MATQHFSIKYDGPAVGDGNDIDASLFGGSLVALADLIQEAQSLLEPDGVQYRVRVKTTGPGSFEVFLELKEFWDSVVGIFSSDDAQAIDLLTRIFGAAGLGLLGVLRWLRGREPDRVIETPDSVVYQVGTEELVVERRVHKLYSSKRMRRSFVRFVQPVRRDMVNNLTVNIPNAEPAVITPDDRPAIDSALDEGPVLDQTNTMRLRIEAIRWRSNRWEFREPTIGLLWATIEDAGFLDRIDKRIEPMNKGDVLECVVRVRQWDNQDGTYKTDYTIVSVIDVLHGDDPGGQMSLGPTR